MTNSLIYKGQNGVTLLYWAMALFLLPAVSMGQERHTALVEALFTSSDIHQYSGQLTKAVQAGFEHGLSTHMRLKEMPRSTITGLRSALKTAFAPERFEDEILHAFKLKLSNDDIQEVLAWMGSVTGKKIAQLEAAATRSDHGAGLQQFQSRLQAAPNRIKRIGRLDLASKTTDTRINVTLKAQLAIVMVLVEHLPATAKPTTDTLMTAIENTSRRLIEEAMRDETQLFFHYTYHSLTTAELDSYVAFAASPAGARYYDATAAGIDAALTAGCHQWRQMIASIIQP
jgi:hypothetical protein